MPMQLIILACAFFIILTMMGKNPLEEYAKQQLLKGPDPFLRAIHDHQEKSQETKKMMTDGGAGGSAFGRNGGAGLSGGGAFGSAGGMNVRPSIGTNPMGAANPYGQPGAVPNMPVHMMPPQDQSYRSNSSNPYIQNQAQPVPSGVNPSVYPPGLQPSAQPTEQPVQGQQPGMTPSGNFPWSPQSTINRLPDNDLTPTFTLRGGSQFAFSGEYVTTVDKDGKRIPMPDGEYTVFEGGLKLVVKDGKKIISSN